MVDTTYQPKVYEKQGGDELVVASGGLITVESGGTVAVATGATLTVAGVTIDADTLAMDGLTATADELNTLAGVTAGTAAASKAVVLDANLALDAVRTASLNLGTSGSETAVTATGAEINTLAGVTAGTRTASKAVVVDANGRIDRWDVGGFASATAGTGTALSASVTAASRVYADDGNAAIAAGNAVRASVSRTLVQAAQSGDVSIFGHQGQVKMIGAMTHTGHVAGLWGYAELPSGASTTGPVAGLYAMCDVASGATIGAGGVVSGLLISSNDLSGTHTGIAAAAHIQNPVAGTFDTLFAIGDATGCHTDTALSGGTSKYLKVRIGAVDYTIEATCGA